MHGYHYVITMGRSDDEKGIELELEIDRFLDHLHRFTLGMDGGYWVTMRARRVEPSPERPHGLEYALILHGPDDERLLGYDNAHPVSQQSGPAHRSKMPITLDHIDESGKPSRPYMFTSPFQLLADFWADVNRILERESQR